MLLGLRGCLGKLVTMDSKCPGVTYMKTSLRTFFRSDHELVSDSYLLIAATAGATISTFQSYDLEFRVISPLVAMDLAGVTAHRQRL